MPDHPTQEAEKVTLRRWIGDGMPPGPWSTNVELFVVAIDDRAEVEIREFVPASSLTAAEARERELREALERLRDVWASDPTRLQWAFAGDLTEILSSTPDTNDQEGAGDDEG